MEVMWVAFASRAFGCGSYEDHRHVLVSGSESTGNRAMRGVSVFSTSLLSTIHLLGRNV